MSEVLEPDAPLVGEEYFTSREGIRAVDAMAGEMRCLWRETPLVDIGIDGQLEHLNAERRATGGLVAVQVKSGPSYMKVDAESIIFYPEPKHRRYWESFPVPVILVIHNPATGLSHWEDARRALRNPMRRGQAIRVPLTNVLGAGQKEQIFEGCGILGADLMSVRPLVAHMARCTDCNDISFLDLFLLGLTDVAHALFFHVALYVDLIELTTGELTFGESGNQFIHDYVRFLVGQRLIRYEITDFVIDWEDKEMTPVFLAKLTTRGRMITSFLHEHLPRESDGVACEGFVDVVRESVVRKLVGLRTLIEATRTLTASDV